jgi:hypothetical protein
MRDLSSLPNLSSLSGVNLSKIVDAITENLPTREDVIKAVGLGSRRSSTSDIATVVTVFGAGLLIGAGLALLFAPKRGEETRRDLGERISSMRERDTSQTERSSSGGSTGLRSTSPSAGM